MVATVKTCVGGLGEVLYVRKIFFSLGKVATNKGSSMN